jgi:hypothetical protein
MKANRSYRSLDFGSCQIRVLRVNDAPASFPVPTLETPLRMVHPGSGMPHKHPAQCPLRRHRLEPRQPRHSYRVDSLIHARSYALPSPPSLRFCPGSQSPQVEIQTLADHDTTRSHPGRRLDPQNPLRRSPHHRRSASSNDQPFFSFRQVGLF